MHARFRGVVVLGLLGAAGLCGGCPGVQSMFDERFIAALGGGTRVASIPGTAPALLVAVENRTDRHIQAIVAYRDGEGTTDSYTTDVEPFARTAQALVCPIEQITLGSLSDPDAIGAVVYLGGGTLDDPFIEVEPFGVVLEEGVNFDCGDSLTFVVQPSGETLSGYQTFVFIRRAEGGS